MKRTFVGVGVAAVMAVLMAGCGGGSDTTTQANAPVTQPTTTAPATTTTPSMTATPSKGKKGGKGAKAKGGAGSTGGSATPTAAEAKWAKDLCSAMTSQVQALQPPAVDPKDPQSSVDSLVKFLGDVDEQIGTQRDTIAKVGAPPIDGAGKAYDRVLQRLEAVRKQVAGVRGDLGKADPKDGQEMMNIFSRLGKQLQDFASYKGPVADLVGRNGKIARAIAGEQACATLR